MRKRLLLAAAVALVAASALGAAVVNRSSQGIPALPATSAGPWSRLSGPGPSVRWGHLAVVDAKRDRMLSFAGAGAAMFNELWSLDLATRRWQKIDFGEGPEPRWMPAGVVDTARDRLVIYGGNDGYGRALSDTWALDLETAQWTRLADGPGARYDHMMDVDRERGVAWMFAGFRQDASAANDLWQFDLVADRWSRVDVSGDVPPPRTNAVFAHEPESDRLWVTGGHDAEAINADSFEFDIGTGRWRQLAESDVPTARAHGAGAYDPKCRAVWVFGGDNKDDTDVDETVVFGVRDAAATFHVIDGGTAPAPRRHASMAFDQRRRQLVMAFGWQGKGDLLDDVWILPVGDRC